MLLHATRTVRTRPTGPTPVALPDLVDLTRRVAAEVRSGAHEAVVDPERRWYRRLDGPEYSTDYVDVWLISWATDQATELHDHAGSLGALTVVSGALRELRWTGELRDRRLRAGRSVGFPLGHVHDVVNPEAAPAVSVHAYSPPLAAMSFYAVDGAGHLRRTRTALTTSDTTPDPA